MTALSIMQGRLVPRERGRYQSFPWQSWTQEFAHAAADGFSGIELIYEEDPTGLEQHPLHAEGGIGRISQLCHQHGVSIDSVCADEFVARPIFQTDAAWMLFDRVLERAARLGARCITLPCVDRSSLPDSAAISRLAIGLRHRRTKIETLGLMVGLETDLAPDTLAHLIHEIDHPRIGVTWDTGNSAAAGFDPRQEIAAYGDRIVSIHIKDRVLHGGSVPLGQGAVDWNVVAEALHSLNLPGPIVLQAARAENDQDDRSVARDQAAWIRHQITAPVAVP